MLTLPQPLIGGSAKSRDSLTGLRALPAIGGLTLTLALTLALIGATGATSCGVEGFGLVLGSLLCDSSRQPSRAERVSERMWDTWGNWYDAFDMH